MPVYTVQLKPDTINDLFWVDLGNETHVELDREQAGNLLNSMQLLADSYNIKKELHPLTLAPVNTISYNVKGELDTTGMKVLPGKGIIRLDLYKAYIANLVKEELAQEELAQRPINGGKSRRRMGSQEIKEEALNAMNPDFQCGHNPEKEGI